MPGRLAVTLAALVASLSIASPAHAATVPPPGAVAAFSVSAPMRESINQTLMAAKAAKAGTYTVVRGDTLSRIAARHCGHAAAYPALAAASGVADPNLIFPGQRITLACAGAAVTTAAKTPAKPAPVLASGSAGAVVAYARAQVGKAYVWGTAGPSTFDCSGLVMAAYAHIGIKLPHQSESILAYGRSVSRANLAPGDILWPYHGHVSIYIGDGKVVEAATPSQGVKVSTIYAFMTARRLV